MGIFGKSKITSDEYADVSSKIVKLSTDVLILQQTIERMEIRLKSYHSRLTKSINEEQDLINDGNFDAQEAQRRLLGFADRKD